MSLSSTDWFCIGVLYRVDCYHGGLISCTLVLAGEQVLHFDVNKTIIMCDPVKGVNCA